MKRFDDREYSQLRKINFVQNYTKYAEGSVLVELGSTKVICTATIDDNVPPFLKNSNRGWLTAEYSMLPRATHTRNRRDSVGNKPNARNQEISRLIGRSLRSCLDLTCLPGRQIIIDCDVIQADGGTRVASITGGFIALYDAIKSLLAKNIITINPIKFFVAAISVGILQEKLLLDLNYEEDSKCDADMNIVMQEDFKIIEIQASAESALGIIDRDTLNQLLELAEIGVKELIDMQKKLLL